MIITVVILISEKKLIFKKLPGCLPSSIHNLRTRTLTFDARFVRTITWESRQVSVQGFECLTSVATFACNPHLSMSRGYLRNALIRKAPNHRQQITNGRNVKDLFSRSAFIFAASGILWKIYEFGYFQNIVPCKNI